MAGHDDHDIGEPADGRLGTHGQGGDPGSFLRGHLHHADDAGSLSAGGVHHQQIAFAHRRCGDLAHHVDRQAQVHESVGERTNGEATLAGSGQEHPIGRQHLSAEGVEGVTVDDRLPDGIWPGLGAR